MKLFAGTASIAHVSVLRWVRNFAAGKRIVVIGNVQNFSHIEWLNRLDASLSRVHRKFSC